MKRDPSAEKAYVTVENVNVPGYTHRVVAAPYLAMKAALLEILPRKVPGLTQREIREQVVRHLPADLFLGGAKANWWSKCVQLDLEAKGLIEREAAAKPLRWFRTR